MNQINKSFNKLLNELQERAKELNCIYQIEEILNKQELSLDSALELIVSAIPPGWQYPEITSARMTYNEKIYKTSNFKITPWILDSNIKIRDKVVGKFSVCYTEEIPLSGKSPFLIEEQKLLDTITDRLGHYILHKDLEYLFKDFENATDIKREKFHSEWRTVLDMVRKTDPNLFMNILTKLLHQLCWKGIVDAELLLKHSLITQGSIDETKILDENMPLQKKQINTYDEYINAVLNLVDKYMNYEEVLQRIQKWIQEDKSSALVKAVDTQRTSFTEIGEALRKYYHLAPERVELSLQMKRGLRVSLLRRFYTDNLDFINVGKDYVKLIDFYNLIEKMIFSPSSRGKLGGKSSGVFLAANILAKDGKNSNLLTNIKIPKTWYITSDIVLSFMDYNNLEEVLEQKYKSVEEIRLEYPRLIHLFKNSQFPPDIVKGLSHLLDDMGETPLIVRSSSLLEDQMGSTFSGKYKSLFLANQGEKQERLNLLMDAIAEVYASTFGPDPIEYRAERGLLDYHEEMGIMIQEVVGNKIGKYFFPSFAGVAFSNNEFRWSSRITQKDGLVRIVAGLGTRAVDRVSDDFPFLIAPGQPNLKVNMAIDETIRYSQKNLDVIDLDTNEFKTIKIDDLLRKHGSEIPGIEMIISKISDDMIREIGFDTKFRHDDLCVTFDGLVSSSDFIQKLTAIMKLLEEKLHHPIDIEFAWDGKDFYLLQCRAQSRTRENKPDLIPKEIPDDKILFTASKFISNGRVPEISHIVYVDPYEYSQAKDRLTLLEVGNAVGKLNKLLPKRKFILMGPGRWGSRGDVKLGVNVTYSDINNTAVLIEIARKRGNYVPELSFGTHFFQDLVEASIRYLPLYPDDEGIKFNENFLQTRDNKLTQLLPEFSRLERIIKVIDISETKNGLFLRILMNAELDEAVGFLSDQSFKEQRKEKFSEYSEELPDTQWRWRLKMAEKIASELEAEKFGVKGIYLFGSTKNTSAAPGSDIDLLIHDIGDKKQRSDLSLWLDGWSLCLGEINYLRTGYKTDKLLDIHFVTDEDIENKNSYAVKIGAVTDAARPLSLKNAGQNRKSN